MINEKHKTAAYKIIPSQGGNRYSFFCELSGMLVCTTGTVLCRRFRGRAFGGMGSGGQEKILIYATCAADGSIRLYIIRICLCV